MSNPKNIHLPSFAQRLFHDRVRCPRCQTKITEQDIRFAGAGRANDGSICFTYQYGCPACQKIYAVTDKIRVFTKPDWWDELAEWHDDRLNERRMPTIGRMVLDMIELDGIWIRGGYKGEVGPVMLVYSVIRSGTVEGFLRLERNSAVSLFDHEAPHGLSQPELSEFAVAAEGSTFDLDGRRWTKMSAMEIEDIIRDRVFEVTKDDDPVTIPKPKPGRGYGKHSSKRSTRTSRPPRNSDS